MVKVLHDLTIQGEPALYGRGSAFPSIASWTGLPYWNTTLQAFGTPMAGIWVGDEVTIPVAQYQGTVPLSGDTEFLAFSPRQDRGIYFTRFSVSFYTGGGVDPPNNHYWNIVLRRLTSGVSFTTVATHQTPNNGWTHITDILPASMSGNPTSGTDIWHQIYLTKSGTPNNIYPIIGLWGRPVLG